MKKYLIILMCALSLSACKQASTQISDNATQINAALAAHKAVLLDVRSPDEFNSGHVNGAILAPHDSIAQTIAGIASDKNQTIYLYCRSGHRAGIALDTLKGMGYTKVENLGGLGDLAQYGLAVVK